MHELTPWTIEGDRCVYHPEVWRELEALCRCTTCGGTGEIDDPSHPMHPNQTKDASDETWCLECGGEGVVYPIVNLTDCDPFAPFNGVRAEFRKCRTTDADLRRELFRRIDNSNLRWVITTRFPELVREGWPEHVSHGQMIAFDDEAAKAYGVERGEWTDAEIRVGNHDRTNLALCVGPIHTQEEANRLIGGLIKLRDLTPVLGVELDPREGIDIRRWTELGLECSGCSWVGAEHQANRHDFDDEPDGWQCPVCGHPCGHRPLDELLDWVRVRGTTEPLDPDWIRSLRDQCAAAEVPFEFCGWGDYRPPRMPDFDFIALDNSSPQQGWHVHSARIRHVCWHQPIDGGPTPAKSTTRGR